MKILIFLENDLVVRHFIFSKAFIKLNTSHEVVYVFPDGHKRMGSIKTNKLDLNDSKRLKLLPFQKRLKLWKIRFYVEKLKYKKGISRKVLRRWRSDFKIGNPFYALYLYVFFGLPIIFPIFTFIVNFLLSKTPNKEMIKILHEEKPDLLLHPSVLQGSYIDDVIFYGNKIKKPVIVIMNSWDNPLTKRSVVNKNYFLLVWGPQTKQHAIKYMGLKEENVIEFGSAQFDIYNHDKSNDWKSLRQDYGFKDDVKTLLYAGSSKNSDEFSHLKKIDSAIERGLLPKLNLIYRPHPWGNCGYKGFRFKEYNFKNVIFDFSMKDYVLSDFKKGPLKILPNLKNTKDLLLSVDLVISPLSTILLEAMLVGKIPICLMTNDESNADHFRRVSGSPHFKEILENQDVVVINGANNLIEGIKKAINYSSLKGKSISLKKQSEFFISRFEESYDLRLLKFVENIFEK